MRLIAAKNNIFQNLRSNNDLVFSVYYPAFIQIETQHFFKALSIKCVLGMFQVGK